MNDYWEALAPSLFRGPSGKKIERIMLFLHRAKHAAKTNQSRVLRAIKACEKLFFDFWF